MDVLSNFDFFMPQLSLMDEMNRSPIELSSKICLVTGGAGFIGSHLVDRLLQEGSVVRVIDDLSTGKLENLAQHKDRTGFEFIEGSILEKTKVRQAVNGVSLVFHLACRGVRHSIRYPEENHRVNAEGTLNLLSAAGETGTLECFVQVSSSEVYGTSQAEFMDENHPTFPHTVYGASKLAAEAYSRAYHRTYGLPTVIIRPFNVFGLRSHFEGDAGEMIPKSVLRALTGHQILVFGDGSQERDFTFVEDTVDAIVQITASGGFIGETVNIGMGKAITIKKLAEKIVKLTPDTNSGIVYTESRPGDVQRLLCDSSRVRKRLDYKPNISLEEGLSRVIAWFREHADELENWYKQETGKNWK